MADKKLEAIANKVRNGELTGNDPYWKLNIKWGDNNHDEKLTFNIIASQIEKGHTYLKGFASYVNIEEWSLITGEHAKVLMRVSDLTKKGHHFKELDKNTLNKIQKYIERHKEFKFHK